MLYSFKNVVIADGNNNLISKKVALNFSFLNNLSSSIKRGIVSLLILSGISDNDCKCNNVTSPIVKTTLAIENVSSVTDCVPQTVTVKSYKTVLPNILELI
ncbi:hypothetical protein BCR32DRAFT_283210 [Anaeromyces robustus]|uniref:Uncharacterized protein n=1 Tax=Anaeromyces robustus TaxID=1754192 RepID=A0A1Y1WWB8_9FUNG|nr:hypothetical protein BCR32DRAFT_283210 [Anaeromyces robustus]|eukprot:ORX77424.1 hypothetical protein BCR32DRAFT_283210 [Anaeromyces robustus]